MALCKVCVLKGGRGTADPTTGLCRGCAIPGTPQGDSVAAQRRKGGENSKAKKAPEPRVPLDVTTGRAGVLDTIQHAVESTVALDNSAARNATLGKLAALAMDVLEPSKVEDMEAEVAALRETLGAVRKVMRRQNREPWNA